MIEFPEDLALLEGDGQRVLLNFTLSPSLKYFDGHFPLQAVLPGVTQILWVSELGRRHFALDDWCFAGVPRVKFLAPLIPGDAVRLELKRKDADGECFIDFKYVRIEGGEEIPSSSGRITLQKRGGS